MSNKNDNTTTSVLFYLIYSHRVRGMNDFLCKSVSYSGNWTVNNDHASGENEDTRKTVVTGMRRFEVSWSRWILDYKPSILQCSEVDSYGRYQSEKNKNKKNNSSGVARICCEEGHSRRTSGPGAAAARWLTVLWLMQYWLKELWVVDICTSWSRRLHNIWIVGCQTYFKVN